MQKDKPQTAYRYKNKKQKNKYQRTQLMQAQRRQTHRRSKFTKVFLPYLLLSIVTIVGYGALRWLIDIYLDILPLKQGYWNFGIPIVLSALVVYFGLNPYYKRLTLPYTYNSTSFLFLAMTLTLATPLILSQSYLTQTAYHVVAIDSVSDIRDYPSSYYFDVKHYQVNKPALATYMDSAVRSSSYDSDTALNYYMATPFLAADNIWLGTEDYTSYDNHMAEENKNQHYQSFIKQAQTHYQTKDFSRISYFQRLKSSDERTGYLQAVAGTTNTNRNDNNHDPIILVPQSGTLSDHAHTAKIWGIGTFMVGMAICLLMIMSMQVQNPPKSSKRKNKHEHKLKQKTQAQPFSESIKKTVHQLNVVRKNTPATFYLVLSTVLGAVAAILQGVDIFFPTRGQIAHAGGVSIEALQQGEYWRLLSALFIPSDIISLLMTLLILLLIGYILEPIIGKWRFVSAFFICGFLGYLSVFVLIDVGYLTGAHGNTLSLSGAATVVLLSKRYKTEQRQIYGILIGAYLGINIIVTAIHSVYNIHNLLYILINIAVGALVGALLLSMQRVERILFKRRNVS